MAKTVVLGQTAREFVGPFQLMYGVRRHQNDGFHWSISVLHGCGPDGGPNRIALFKGEHRHLFRAVKELRGSLHKVRKAFGVCEVSASEELIVEEESPTLPAVVPEKRHEEEKVGEEFRVDPIEDGYIQEIARLKEEVICVRKAKRTLANNLVVTVPAAAAVALSFWWAGTPRISAVMAFWAATWILTVIRMRVMSAK